MNIKNNRLRIILTVFLVIIPVVSLLYTGCKKNSGVAVEIKEQAKNENNKNQEKLLDDMDMKDIDMENISKPGSSERKILYYVDPMHPAYKSDKPGKAPDCGMDLVPVYSGEGDTGETMMQPGGVMISTAKQQLIGVTYDKVKSVQLVHTIRAVGKVTYDETKIVRISPKIDGWVEKVYVDYTGKLVKKGDPLISIYSPELVATQQEYLLALKTSNSLSKSPFKEVASGGKSLLEASRKRLELWDITEEEIKKIEQSGEAIKTLTLYSPNSGFVLAKNVYERQRVTPENELYEIANLSRVWVIAEIYEYEAPAIKLGQKAAMSLSYDPDETYSGAITYIYPDIDPSTRTLKVRLEFANPKFKLKPEMYANVFVEIDYGNPLSVPEEAVLDSGAEQIVFVTDEKGRFEPRIVKLGAKVDKRYIILDGLKEDETIVTSGNFLIDSESRLKSALGGMTAMPGMEHGADNKGTQPVEKEQPHSQHKM